MRRKRILVFPFDLLSHYLRCITLAQDYTACEILFVSSRQYNNFVTRAGYSTFECESFDPNQVMEKARRFDFSWLNRADLERIYLAQVHCIKQLQPDLVIGDTSPTLKMAAESCSVPLLSVMNAYMTRYYAEVRQLSRTHPAYRYLRIFPQFFLRSLTQVAEHVVLRRVHRPFRYLRRKYTLRPVSNYLHELEGDENLLCDREDLFPQRRLPDHFKFRGPLLYAFGGSEQALLNLLPPERPNIFVCMGSSGDISRLAFLANERYAGFNIIVAGDPGPLYNVKHVYHKPFIHLDVVLPLCRLMICHGGNGTVYTGLKHKIPLLCLSSHFEQEWNIQMLEKNGLGRSINNDPERLVNEALFAAQSPSAEQLKTS